MKKILVPGLITGFIMLVVSMVGNFGFGAIIPSVAREYRNPALFRPWSDPAMNLFFLYPFALGLIFSFLWQKHKGGDFNLDPEWVFAGGRGDVDARKDCKVRI